MQSQRTQHCHTVPQLTSLHLIHGLHSFLSFFRFFDFTTRHKLRNREYGTYYNLIDKVMTITGVMLNLCQYGLLFSQGMHVA